MTGDPLRCPSCGDPWEGTTAEPGDFWGALCGKCEPDLACDECGERAGDEETPSGRWVCEGCIAGDGAVGEAGTP